MHTIKVDYIDFKYSQALMDDEIAFFDKTKGPLDTNDNHLAILLYLRHVLINPNHPSYKTAIRTISNGVYDELWNLFLNDSSILNNR
jgi:hypothetical protein